jgi:hypothetical protein
MKNLIVDLPKDPTARVNYMSVLASCENYAIPSSPYLSVQEFIASKMYNWYHDMLPSALQRDEIAWYNNYE